MKKLVKTITMISAVLAVCLLSTAQASKTDYLENALQDQMFRGVTYTFPSTVYVALFTTTITDDGTGTEVTGGSYARVGVASNLTNWNNTQGNTTGNSTGTDGTIENAVAITFPAPTANWGQVQAFALFDAPTGGNMLRYGNLNTAKTVNNGDSAPSFGAGALTFTDD